MSILIKGVKIPKHCLECMFYRTSSLNYDYCCISSATPKGYIPADCPLVDLPDHGDLIDKSDRVDVQYYDDKFGEWSIKTKTVCEVLAEMCEVPPKVVIPAERSEE